MIKKVMGGAFPDEFMLQNKTLSFYEVALKCMLIFGL